MLVYQMTVKRLVAVILATVILVLMPIEGFGKGKAYAAESAVTYSKSTLASMFLASMGMSYVLVNTAASNLKDYLEEKIAEFEVIDGGKLPGGSDGGDWKSTIGGILFGAAAVDIYNRFIAFLKGEQEDNTEEIVVNRVSSQVTIDGKSYNYFDVDYVSSNVLYDYGSTINYDQFITLLNASYFAEGNSYEWGDPYNHILQYLGTGNTYLYYVRGISDNTTRRSMYFYTENYADTTRTTDATLVLTRNGYLCHLFLSQGDKTKYMFQNANKLTDEVLENVEAESVNIVQKLGDVMQESVPSSDGIIIEQPVGIDTWKYNPYNVPTPVSDSDLWNQISASIEENTSDDVVYNPTYQIYEDYDSAQNIASGSYDTPAGPEDIPAEEASPGVINELVSDLWYSFKSTFPWDQLKVKFPFSIPYDIVLFAQGLTGEEYNVLTGLPSDPGEAAPGSPPVYELDLPLPGGEDTYRVTLDFSQVEDIVPFIRAGAGIIFTAILFGGL